MLMKKIIFLISVILVILYLNSCTFYATELYVPSRKGVNCYPYSNYHYTPYYYYYHYYPYRGYYRYR